MKLTLFWGALYVFVANVAYGFQLMRTNVHAPLMKQRCHTKASLNLQHKLQAQISYKSSMDAFKSTVVGYDVYQDASTDNFGTKLIDMKYAPLTKIFRHQMTWVILICLIRDGAKRVLTFYRRNILKKDTFPEVNNPLFLARRQEAEYASLGLETYECAKCGNQFKPATGRAKTIMSRPNFHCTRCQSKADKFFNIDDTKDPRAIKRWKRLNKEQEELEQREAEYYETNHDGEDDEEEKEKDIGGSGEDGDREGNVDTNDTRDDSSAPHYADDYDRGYTD